MRKIVLIMILIILICVIYFWHENKGDKLPQPTPVCTEEVCIR